MSEAFLIQILKTENNLQPDGGQPCYIRLQQCGKICPESGVVEIEVGLPCSHTVGSACIAQWLHTNNTCPFCRETFFPREHQPYSESAIMRRREFGDQDSDDEDGWDLTTIALYVYADYCAALRLRNSIVNLVQKMLRKTGPDDLDLLWQFGPEETAAACIYMATHLLRQPKTFREIVRVANIRVSDIWKAYQGIYPYRRELLEENWVDEYGNGDLVSALSRLPLPPGPPVSEQDP